MKALVTSRKFKLTIAAALMSAAGAIAGEITWNQAISYILVAIVANQLGIAIEDVRKNEPPQAD